jgi:hypothetical protein
MPHWLNNPHLHQACEAVIHTAGVLGAALHLYGERPTEAQAMAINHEFTPGAILKTLETRNWFDARRRPIVADFLAGRHSWATHQRLMK